MGVQLPAEFEKMMAERLGKEFALFRSSLEQQPPVSIRVNPRKPYAPEGEKIPWCADGRYLAHRPMFTQDPRLHGGGYYVQEASSMFLCEAVRQTVDLKKNPVILDLCAAPGGKSTLLSGLMPETGLLVSNEVIRNRAGILLENLQKWGSDHVIVTNNDPSAFQQLPGTFDAIIVDAPCSGEGLFRKDPTAINEWSVDHVHHCAARQNRILEDIWPALKSGGILIYSTCTYNHEENIKQVTWMGSKLGAESVKLKLDSTWGVETVGDKNHFGYQFYPHRVTGEGFFLTIARKQSPANPPYLGRTKWTSPSAAILQEIKPWVRDAERKIFLLHKDIIRFMPNTHEALSNFISERFNLLSAGTPAAEVTRNKLVPEHALALSVHYQPSSLPDADADLHTALSYLRKDAIALEGFSGFARITYQGLGLGWVNCIPGRVNNLYPVDWRIRTR